MPLIWWSTGPLWFRDNLKKRVFSTDIGPLPAEYNRNILGPTEIDDWKRQWFLACTPDSFGFLTVLSPRRAWAPLTDEDKNTKSTLPTFFNKDKPFPFDDFATFAKLELHDLSLKHLTYGEGLILTFKYFLINIQIKKKDLEISNFPSNLS